jgi:hypothetical protein
MQRRITAWALGHVALAALIVGALFGLQVATTSCIRFRGGACLVTVPGQHTVLGAAIWAAISWVAAVALLASLQRRWAREDYDREERM